MLQQLFCAASPRRLFVEALQQKVAQRLRDAFWQWWVWFRHYSVHRSMNV
jgi:hypothetical protein